MVLMDLPTADKEVKPIPNMDRLKGMNSRRAMPVNISRPSCGGLTLP